MHTNSITNWAIALTIAGSDSSGGAGIQADIKAFSALGVYGASVITALTAQNTMGVQGVFAVPPAFVAQQLDSVLDDLDVNAIKTGMLANAEIIEAVVGVLKPRQLPVLVVDPVMVATSGDHLLQQDAVSAMRDLVLPMATLITPNLAEAAVLLDCPVAKSHTEMSAQATDLSRSTGTAVLLKGGHFPHDDDGPTASDVLVDGEETRWYRADWVETANTHGTGCTLASAIAAGCANNYPLVEAIDRAKKYLTRALEAGRALRLGRGNGPVDHLVS